MRLPYLAPLDYRCCGCHMPQKLIMLRIWTSWTSLTGRDQRQVVEAKMSVAVASLGFMKRTRLPIPAGLADMPPGPALAAALATIDPRRLGGLDCVEVMRAQHRQAAHEQARMMATMVEVGLCGIGPDDELPRM